MTENTNSNRTEISFEEFTKVDLRVGKIVCAENLECYKKI